MTLASEDVALVPGRDCGGCTVCCTVLIIDQPDIQKEAGVTCKHCVGGCTVYETRFKICRGFHCAWRQLAIFGEAWRPDKSGVFADLEVVGDATGISLMLVGNPLKTVRQPWFIEFVATGVLGGTPLVLALPGPRGHLGARITLNTAQMMAASRISRGKVKELLELALKKLTAYETKPRAIVNTGNNVSP